jgi:hypothetical protein
MNITHSWKNCYDASFQDSKLPSFGAESFIFQFPVQKYVDEDTPNYNFARCFVWV